MDQSRSPWEGDAPANDRQPSRTRSRRGLPLFETASTGAFPRYLRDHVIEPFRTIGTAASTLQVSYWRSTVEDSPQIGDPAFMSFSLQTSPAIAWRDTQRSGPVTTLPFEGAHWRFEAPVSFTQLHLPFHLLGMVSHALFERDLAHGDLRMAADVGDPHLSGFLRAIPGRVDEVEPTNLLLDSWALIISEAVLRCMSSHGERHPRGPFGKIPGRGIARVIDYIEAGIDQDLRLAALGHVAGISVYHFARGFRDTVGMSPHAYVLSRRVARASAMLARSGTSVADVALACGFSSQAHLTTAFRGSLGVTPGAYRRSLS